MVFNPRINFYKIVFYDTYDDGAKVYHAGIDAKGLQRSLVQTCIDKIMSLPCVKRDEEGKLYFDFLDTDDSEVERIAVFIAFMLSQDQDYYFPLREEILRRISPNFAMSPWCGGDCEMVCEKLEPSQEQCVTNMKKLVEAQQMTLKEYEDNVDEIVMA